MAIPFRPGILGRYRDIALLLVKYGRSDLVRAAGLDGTGVEPQDAQAPPGVTVERAGELADDLEKLGPTFIKLGQLLSTRPDRLPEPYLESLARLQDDVAQFSFAEVERIVQEELGVRLSKAFREFDATPIAAASLGQVHRALMRDGRPVAVKVQRPGIRKRVAEDLDALGDIAEWLDEHSETSRQLQVRDMFEEFRGSLVRELDYRNEARNLVSVGRNLEGFDRILVPQPVEDYSTSRVLTTDLVRGRNITRLGPLAHLERDGPGLAGELFRAYLKQVLVDGVFHADPQPGNVLMTDDGRLALIDLGMIARLTRVTQQNLLQLLLALADGRPDEVAAIGMRIGTRADGFDAEGYRRRVTELVAEQHDLELGQIEVGRVVIQVAQAAAGSGLRLPRELTMLGKTLLNLDRIAWLLDPGFNPTQCVRLEAPALIEDRLKHDLSPSNMVSSLFEIRDFFEQMPGRVNRIMDVVASNELQLRVHAIDEERLLAGMHKIANRITVGLVLSALIVGAALTMRVQTPFTILGYPSLSILLFLLAAGGATALLWQILRDDYGRHPRR